MRQNPGVCLIEADPNEVRLKQEAQEFVKEARSRGGDMSLSAAVGHIITMGAMQRISCNENRMGCHALQAINATKAIGAFLGYGNPGQQINALQYLGEIMSRLPYDGGETPDDIRGVWDGFIANLDLDEADQLFCMEHIAPGLVNSLTDAYSTFAPDQLAAWYVRFGDAPDEYLDMTRDHIAGMIEAGTPRLEY